MDIIRLYCNSTNITPRLLISGFLKYLGFYIEDREKKQEYKSGAVSAVDIYILGNGETDIETEYEIGRLDFEKTMIVCSERWRYANLVDLETFEVVLYREHKNKDFLSNFIDKLHRILKRTTSKKRLVRSLKKWNKNVHKLAKLYLDYDILPVTQYARCLRIRKELILTACSAYQNFIYDLEELIEKIDGDCSQQRYVEDGNCSDLLRYASLCAKYELDRVCMRNGMLHQYDARELFLQCSSLERKYKYNEALLFLKADILLELQGDWMQSFDIYQDKRAAHCFYGDYKCGKIYRHYLEEYRPAIRVLKRALLIKPQCYDAWYQFAKCCEAEGVYEHATIGYRNIMRILRQKFESHLLSPDEIEGLFKAAIALSKLYKYNIGDEIAALEYRKYAQKVAQEAERDEYLKKIWVEQYLDDSFVKKLQRNISSMVVNQKHKSKI